MFRRLLVVALLIEVGLLLIVAPWSTYWERNYFSELWPGVQGVLSNNFVRGAISGIGAVNVLGALSDLASLVTRKPAS